MNQVGIVGLGTMGANLARNFARNNVETAVFNRTYAVTEDFLRKYSVEGRLQGFQDLEVFVNSLQVPRKIFLMVTAGKATDALINQLQPLLSAGDIIIDGGNANYKDTIHRTQILAANNIEFIGCGVSGGEKGALNGPSLMPGGKTEVLAKIMPLLTVIAAKDFNGNPCVHPFEGIGAGNLIKTVHNGIEYAIMQVLADAYELLRKGYSLSPERIAEIFRQFNQTELNGFLLETAIQVLEKPDTFNQNQFLVDYIADTAGAKGTGSWTLESAIEYAIPVPTIAAALFARQLSSKLSDRQAEKDLFQRPNQDLIEKESLEVFVSNLEKAIWLGVVSSFIQGVNLINQVSVESNWGVYEGDVVRVWQGGCIIRTEMLNYFPLDKNLGSLRPKIASAVKALSEVNAMAARSLIAVPAFSASFDYISYSSDVMLPTNLVQGMRDAFGAHTFQRTDKEGSFTENWE